MEWYSRVTNDIANLPDFIDHFTAEFSMAQKEVKITGRIEKQIAELPGITEHRFTQLQTIEAVLQYLEIQLRKIRREYFQKYLENYNRQLSSRDVEKYVDGEPNVIDMEVLINEVSLLRNRYLGIMKGIDSKAWQLGNITKLRAAGLESFSID
jgi:hypothetical protein